MLPQRLAIEHELKEGVHLHGVLGQDKPAVVLECELLQAEEREIPEDLIQHVVIAVSR